MYASLARPVNFQQPVASAPTAGRTNNPLDQLALSLGVLYLFIILSRILDNTLPFLHIPMVVLILLTLVSIACGAFWRGLTSKLGIVLTLWVAWMGITVPFSQWKGGSSAVYMVVLQQFVLAICLIGVGQTVKDVSRLMSTVAWGGLVAALLSFVYGEHYDGRLVLGSGTFRDPNIYAMFLVLTLPVWFWLAARASNIFVKCVMYVALVPIFYALLRTGSRGGAVGLVIVFAGLFATAPMKRKLFLLAAGAIVFVAAMTTLPEDLKTRYLSTFQADSDTMNADDAGSAYQRRVLLLDSLKLTLEFPIFGAGIDQFSQTNWFLNHLTRGNGPGAMVTHNTYTQASSETGIPGFILLLVVMFQCFRSINAVIRQNRPPKGDQPAVVAMATHLRLSFITVAVCSFFLSEAYGPLIYVVVALCGAFHEAIKAELKMVPALSLTPVNPVHALGIKPSRFY